MTRRDKREIGERKRAVPQGQLAGKSDPRPKIPPGPGRSPEIPMARGDENYVQLTITFDDEQEPYDD